MYRQTHIYQVSLLSTTKKKRKKEKEKKKERELKKSVCSEE